MRKMRIASIVLLVLTSVVVLGRGAIAAIGAAAPGPAAPCEGGFLQTAALKTADQLDQVGQSVMGRLQAGKLYLGQGHGQVQQINNHNGTLSRFTTTPTSEGYYFTWDVARTPPVGTSPTFVPYAQATNVPQPTNPESSSDQITEMQIDSSALHSLLAASPDLGQIGLISKMVTGPTTGEVENTTTATFKRVAEQAGTFMHELGHNLGQNHGPVATDNSAREISRVSLVPPHCTAPDQYTVEQRGYTALDGTGYSRVDAIATPASPPPPPNPQFTFRSFTCTAVPPHFISGMSYRYQYNVFKDEDSGGTSRWETSALHDSGQPGASPVCEDPVGGPVLGLRPDPVTDVNDPNLPFQPASVNPSTLLNSPLLPGPPADGMQPPAITQIAVSASISTPGALTLNASTADTDGDGLNDTWETGDPNCYFSNQTSASVDLNCNGAVPDNPLVTLRVTDNSDSAMTAVSFLPSDGLTLNWYMPFCYTCT
jgi:hypothetical protein